MAVSSPGDTSRPPWLHSCLGRLEAEQLLMNGGRDGEFLVRSSESTKGAYVVSLCHQGKVHHYRVLMSEMGYYLQRKKGVELKYFGSLEEVIEFYNGGKDLLPSPLKYPVACDMQEEDVDTDDDYEDNGLEGSEDVELSRVVNIMQESLTTTKVEKAEVDDEFWSWLDAYVNKGVVRDIKSAKLGHASAPDEFCHLMRLASSEIVESLERFARRVEAVHTFFSRCGSKETDRVSQQNGVESNSQSLARKLSNCAGMVAGLDQRAVLLLHQAAVVVFPHADIPSLKSESDNPSPDSESQQPHPMQTFEVQALFAGYLKQKCFLKVNVMEGRLYISRNVEELQTFYTHEQILQLIRSRSNRLKLGMRLEGKGRKDYQFEDIKQRELFCQLVQQMHNMHSDSQEVDSISVFIGTWNMGDAEPPCDISSWFRCHGTGKPLDSSLACLPHDVYAIGTQESALSEKEWIGRIKNSLCTFLKVNLKVVAAQTLWSMRLVVLVKDEHFNKITHVQMSTVKTGIAGVAGNKGGIGIAFYFSGTSICFINCHLTSGSEKCQRRNNNFYDILRSLQLGQVSRKFSGVFDLTCQFHHLFWFGDLNYRLELSVEDIYDCIAKKDYKKLFDQDQLKLEQAQGKAFFEFEEEEINFPPTYRHRRGSRGFYEYKKYKKTGLRINVPSYCDRVLWSTFPEINISNSSYGCTDDIMTSDHSPVFATFNIGVITQYIPASPCTTSQGGTEIRVKHITAHINTSSNPIFYLEIHSSCLEGVIRSKQNSTFATEGSPGFDTHLFKSLDAEQSHWAHPKWTTADFDVGIHPILPDKGYLEQQHMLVAVKSAYGDESYGECVLSLRPLLTGTAYRYKCCLSHRGMFTGVLCGTMFLLKENADSEVVEPLYESFISNDDKEEDEPVADARQSGLESTSPFSRHPSLYKRSLQRSVTNELELLSQGIAPHFDQLRTQGPSVRFQEQEKSRRMPRIPRIRQRNGSTRSRVKSENSSVSSTEGESVDLQVRRSWPHVGQESEEIQRPPLPPRKEEFQRPPLPPPPNEEFQRPPHPLPNEEFQRPPHPLPKFESHTSIPPVLAKFRDMNRLSKDQSLS